MEVHRELPSLRPVEPDADAIRRRRYEADFERSDGPLRSDILPIDLLFDEPFYQLMRQQLLADRLEADHVEGADVVRVLHVLSRHNLAYQQSLPREEHRAIGSTVEEVWATLLRAHDRFVHLDPDVFLDPLTTSDAYVDRYSPDHDRGIVP